MKKKLFIILGVALLLLILFLIFKPSKNKQVERTTTMQQRDLSVEFRETGEVSPRNRLEIKPPFSGRIEQILVVEGNSVKKGQTLAWMSSSERAAMIDVARSKGQEEYNRWSQIYKPTPIIAPMDGFIILRQNEPGQTVGSSDAVLVMADDLIIESKVDETDLRYIKIGDTLQIYLDAYPDETFTGIVEHIAYESTVVSNVTVYAIKIRPVKKPAVFRSGMTATITITSDSKQSVWSLPNNFILTRNNVSTVNVLTSKNQIVKKTVKIGITDGKFTEIISGLEQNDQVVILKSQIKEKAKSFLNRR